MASISSILVNSLSLLLILRVTIKKKSTHEINKSLLSLNENISKEN